MLLRPTDGCARSVYSSCAAQLERLLLLSFERSMALRLTRRRRADFGSSWARSTAASFSRFQSVCSGLSSQSAEPQRPQCRPLPLSPHPSLWPPSLQLTAPPTHCVTHQHRFVLCGRGGCEAHCLLPYPSLASQHVQPPTPQPPSPTPASSTHPLPPPPATSPPPTPATASTSNSPSPPSPPPPPPPPPSPPPSPPTSSHSPSSPFLPSPRPPRCVGVQIHPARSPHRRQSPTPHPHPPHPLRSHHSPHLLDPLPLSGLLQWTALRSKTPPLPPPSPLRPQPLPRL